MSLVKMAYLIYLISWLTLMQYYPLHNVFFTHHTVNLTLVWHFQQELKRWLYHSFHGHIDLPEYGHGGPEKHTAIDSLYFMYVIWRDESWSPMKDTGTCSHLTLYMCFTCHQHMANRRSYRLQFPFGFPS